MTDDLEPITPEQAVDLYLSHREPEVSAKTLQNHSYRLGSFIEWCDEVEIENLNTLSGRDLHEYRVWRQRDVKLITLRGQLATLRVFLEFVASIDGCESGLRERVKLPDVDRDDEASDSMLDTARAQELLAYLEKYRRASREHLITALFWHTGIRLGSLRAIDLEDYHPDERYVWLRHRPPETPLKNQDPAERPISLDVYHNQIVQEYIEHHRHDVTDENGREPLVTSNDGRLSEHQIRSEIYRITQPCQYTDCPHDREKADCEAREYGKYSKCPSSRSPHDIRRGSITHQLRTGTSDNVVSGRCNVSGETLERHYDRRTELEKMEQRREELEGDD